MLFGLSNTRVSPDAFISRSPGESVQCSNESNVGHPVSRAVQRAIGKNAALSVGFDHAGPGSLPCCRPGWKPGILAVCTMDLSDRSMKVIKLADLTTSEFVSEYTEGETQHCVEWSEALGNSRVHQRTN